MIGRTPGHLSKKINARDMQLVMLALLLSPALVLVFAARGVRANLVSPGSIYFKGGVWNMVEQAAPAMYQATLARNPMGRMGTPEEIANAAVFLASPRASFITGSNLICDGAITQRVDF